MSIALLYFITVLMNLNGPGVISLLLVGIAGLTVCGFIAYEETAKDLARKLFRGAAVCVVVLLLIGAFVPNERQLALMAGAYFVTNNTQVQEIAKKAADTAIGTLNVTEMGTKVLVNWMQKYEFTENHNNHQ